MTANKALILLFAILLSGCSGEPSSGPVEIKYDRQPCEYCRMIISDPRFATEIRQAKGGEVFMFDDIGDAMHWLKRAKWKPTDETEIWVRDMESGSKWLDARKVWYLPNQHSPMEYGYGALEAKRENAVSFDEMRAAVIANGSASRCDTPDLDGHDKPHTPDNAADKG